MIVDDEIQIDGMTYFISGEIGSGAVGHVFTVKDEKNRKYALKVIKDYGRQPLIRQMVDQEIKVQKMFTGNPHIIQIYSNKDKGKRMYIVFELGICSLRNRMLMQSHIELKQFLDIALDVTNGLSAIHSKKIIHRDIKPQNIICIERNYKITDFGSLQQGLEGQARIGTPLYLPPEMIFDDQAAYDHKIDVWSLGVTLFEVYFRIHPFYYSSTEQSMKKVYQQLKQNISELTPNFTIRRLLIHLDEKGIYRQQCASIQKKLLVTPKQIIELFQSFFKQAKQRPDIQLIATMFQSLQYQIKDSRIKKIMLKENVKIQELPSDLKFYLDTLNMFYDLSSRYGNQNQKEIEFHIQLGLWYWNHYNYPGSKYIDYNQNQRLKAYKKPVAQLWKEVKTVLFDYWLDLTSNQQLTFFDSLSDLKIRILICGARWNIYKKLSQFMKKITQKTGIQVKNFQELESFLAIFQTNQIKAIEDILVNDYY